MADQIQIVNQATPRDVNQANEPLFRLTTIFPFDFFPDEAILDILKITIRKRTFFLTEQIVTIPMTGSVTVNINKGPFMSQVEISDSETSQVFTRLKYVSNVEAERFQTIVQGIIIGFRQGVNFMQMSSDEILMYANQWGSPSARLSQ